MIEWALDHGDVRVALGDAREQLALMPDASAQCIVTSPPFWGLRDYGTGVWSGGDEGCDHLQARTGRESSTLGSRSGGNPMSDAARERTQERQRTPYAGECGRCGAVRVDHQIGLEETPEQWVEALVETFRECRRVLRDDGVFWLEVGDTYSGAPVGSFNGGGFKDRSAETGGRDLSGVASGGVIDKSKASGVKPKDLVGAPWMLAFALRADGWYLRSENIWERPNPMPESVSDRTTRSHSQVFMLTKKPRYFYDADAIREKPAEYDRQGGSAIYDAGSGHTNGAGSSSFHQMSASGRNARSVWTIPTEPTPFAHFATMPQALAERSIKAGTSEHGCCSECGAPWVRVVEKGEPELRAWSAKGAGHVNQSGSREEGSTLKHAVPRETTGWAPSCAHDAPVTPCTVLDPFMGSGTTALVARRLGRHSVGVELNAEYVEIIRDRLKQMSLLT